MTASNGPRSPASQNLASASWVVRFGPAMSRYRLPASVTTGSISTPSMRACGDVSRNDRAVVPPALPRMAMRASGVPVSSGRVRKASQ